MSEHQGSYDTLAEAERLHAEAQITTAKARRLMVEGHRLIAEALDYQTSHPGETLWEDGDGPGGTGEHGFEALGHLKIAEANELLAEVAEMVERSGRLRHKALAALAPTMAKVEQGMDRALDALPRRPRDPQPGGGGHGSKPPPSLSS
jgi:hypothetical protein